MEQKDEGADSGQDEESSQDVETSHSGRPRMEEAVQETASAVVSEADQETTVNNGKRKAEDDNDDEEDQEGKDRESKPKESKRSKTERDVDPNRPVTLFCGNLDTDLTSDTLQGFFEANGIDVTSPRKFHLKRYHSNIKNTKMLEDDGKTNYCRAFLLIVNCGRQILLEKLKSFQPVDENWFIKFVQNNRNKIGLLRSRNIFTQPEFNQLTAPAPNLNEIDISLLVKLLRNFVLTSPSKGWDKMPNPNDTSVKANVVRLHLRRNTLIHQIRNIEHKEFLKTWSEIKDILKSLAMPKDSLAEKEFEDKINDSMYTFINITDVEEMVRKCQELENTQLAAVESNLKQEIHEVNKNVTGGQEKLQQEFTTVKNTLDMLVQNHNEEKDIRQEKDKHMQSIELNVQHHQKEIAETRQEIELMKKHMNQLKTGSKVKSVSEDSKKSDTPRKKKHFFKRGDVVSIIEDIETVKNLQKNHGEWAEGMVDSVGTIGRVTRSMLRNTVRVKTGDSRNSTWTFNVKCLKFVEDTDKTEKAPPLDSQHNLVVGDRVQIADDKTKLKDLQIGHGGWNDAFIECLGQCGRIVKVNEDDDVRVRIKDNVYTFNPKCCRKLDDAELVEGLPVKDEVNIFSVGDIVKIMDSAEIVEECQRGHGGFLDKMKTSLGACGKVIKIDDDGDILVRVGPMKWTYNPLCCYKVTAEEAQQHGFGVDVEKQHEFCVGDVVKIIESWDQMKQLLAGNYGIVDKMKKSLGQIGRIVRIDNDGELYVKTKAAGQWYYNPECCSKVIDESLIDTAPELDSGDDDDDDGPSIGDLLKLGLFKDLFDEEFIKTIPIDNGNLSVGDDVQIMKDLETVKQLQEGHGGWVEDMKSSLGKIGTVKGFLEGGNGYLVRVKFGALKWAFNPICCNKIDKPKAEPSESQPCMSQSTEYSHIEEFNKRMSDILGNLRVASYSKEFEIFKELYNMKKEDTKTLKEKLDKNPDFVNATYMDVSVLQLACYLGKIETIRCLVERKVDLQAKFEDGNTALHSATYGRLKGVILLLLESGVNPDEKNKEGFTSLHIAVQNGSVACAKALLKHKASVNIKDNQGNTPMHACTAQRSAQIELIDAIFSVDNADFGIQNSKGQNVLHYLSENNCHRAAKTVCERQPDIVNVQHETYRYTALHRCAKLNHDLVAAVLLEYGGDRNIVNNHMSTPLHLAVKEGHQRFVELLVQKECKLDAKDDDGNTALHLAQKLKPDVAYKITQILINRGADVEIRNEKGNLPVDLCNDMNKELFNRDFSSNWDNSMLVTLSENENDYRDVCKQFQKTMSNAKIFNIKRVQNKCHLDMYKVAKGYMEKSYTAKKINERYLFHGTRPDIVNGICTKQFDPRRSGCLDNPLGEGSYYATKAESANKLTKANDDQHRFMILCIVLAGRWTLGKPSYANPPPIDPTDPESECFDSCVDNVDDPMMFCVFHQNRFYPKFIIEYAVIDESSNNQ